LEFFLDFVYVYVSMDERPNVIKKGVGKNWQYGRTLRFAAGAAEAAGEKPLETRIAP